MNIATVANGCRVGIISDTHGLLRPQAVAALQGVELIIHAGDIGKADIIDQLRRIAPVHAIRGNVDTQDWAAAFPETERVDVAGHAFWLVHNIADLDLDPKAAGLSAVVFGHSHMPLIEDRNGVLFINPGSAGPRRFSLPVSLALATVTPGGIYPKIVELAV